MLLDDYKEKGLLFNVNLTETTDTTEVYRGDLVLKLEELTERGDRKPPAIVAKQGVLYAEGEKLKLVVAGLDKLEDLTMIMEHYLADFDSDCYLLFFVHNIKESLIVSIENRNFILEPLSDGMIWNEMLDVLCIEKSDLKGQGSGEKVMTVYKEMSAFKPRYDMVSFEEALTRTVQVAAPVRGAV